MEIKQLKLKQLKLKQQKIMLTLYYILAGIGIVFLLLSLLGGDHDVDLDIDLDAVGDVDSASIFSMRTISAGLVAFGTGALIMLEQDYSQNLQLLVGFVAAICVAYGTYLITKALYSLQGTSNISLSGLIGKIGTITIGTTTNGTSQLKVNTINGPLEFTCKETNEKKLKISDNVTIIKKIGSILLVEKVK